MVRRDSAAFKIATSVANDESGIDDGCIHLFVECIHLAHDALGFGQVGDGLITRRAKVSRYRRNGGGFALVGVGQVASVVNQFATLQTGHFSFIAP